MCVFNLGISLASFRKSPKRVGRRTLKFLCANNLQTRQAASRETPQHSRQSSSPSSSLPQRQFHCQIDSTANSTPLHSSLSLRVSLSLSLGPVSVAVSGLSRACLGLATSAIWRVNRVLLSSGLARQSRLKLQSP